MANTIDSVNEIVHQLRSWGSGSKGDVPEKCERFVKTLEAFMREHYDLQQRLVPLPTRLGDLSDLPPELRAELSGVDLDELESQLVAVINACGGTADLNQVLVGLFRKFKVVQTRRFVQQKLWRMATDGLVWGIPKRKGVYTTTKPTGVEGPASKMPASVAADDNDFGSPAPQPKKEGIFDDEIPF